MPFAPLRLWTRHRKNAMLRLKLRQATTRLLINRLLGFALWLRLPGTGWIRAGPKTFRWPLLFVRCANRLKPTAQSDQRAAVILVIANEVL